MNMFSVYARYMPLGLEYFILGICSVYTDNERRGKKPLE